MKRIFALILLAGAGLNAQTKTGDERWILADVSADSETAVYVDSQTVRRDGDTILVWQNFSDRDGKHMLMREQIRRDRTSRTLSFIQYDAQGKVIYSSYTPREWRESVPGSLQEAVNRQFDRWMTMTALKDTPAVRY